MFFPDGLHERAFDRMMWGRCRDAFVACPVARTFTMRLLLMVTTAGEGAAPDCIVRQLAARGQRVSQAAIFVHVAPWTVNKMRHRANGTLVDGCAGQGAMQMSCGVA